MTRRSAAGPLWLALGAAALAGTTWRVAASPYAPTFDDAWYLETSFRLFAALRSGLAEFAAAYAGAFRIKAPLISVAPLPLYAVAGASERAALGVNVVLAALAAWSTRRVGRRLFSPEAGDAAAALVLLTPLLFGLTRVFFVETLMTALVAATIAAALDAAPGDRRAAARLGLLVGLGLLAKSLFPLYVAAPLWLRRRALLPTAGRAAAVAAAVAATWYAFNLPYVVGFGLSAGFGRIARDYGPASSLSPAALAGYAASVLREGLSWPLAAAGAAVGAWSWLAAGRPRPDEGGRLLLAWAAPLAVFAVGVNKDVRYAAPVLPAFALAAGAAWARLKGSSRTAAGVLLAAAALWVYSAQTFGVPARPALAYNGPARVSAWDRGALLDALERTARDGSVVAIALEHPDMNANNVASLAAERGRRWRAVSLGYAQAGAEGALVRLKDKDADHLVLFEGVPAAELPAFLNRANAGVAAAAASGRLPARETARAAVAPGVTAVVYRIGPALKTTDLR